MGRQAPLGHHPVGQPAQLRTEVSANDGDPEMRAQDIGGVTKETLTQEEFRDRVRSRPAPRRTNRNTRRRHNVHIDSNNFDFEPNTNDPSSRFINIQNGYASLSRLQEAITNSITAPMQRPPP
jgi:hypothetical protein